jgi:hypothetical protein
MYHRYGGNFMRPRMILGLAVVAALGCGGKSFVPVSGKVTMDNKPLAGATVTFLPVADKGTMDAGVGGTGTTNENGEYTLKAINGKDGVEVGHYRVNITKLTGGSGQPQDPDDDRRIPRSGQRNLVPARFSEKTTLTCDVPSGGKSDANFEITSK